MPYQFVEGNYNNFYLERGIRKSTTTTRLIFRAIENLIKTTDWSLYKNKPIWVSTPKEELHFTTLEKALNYLEKNNKFALFVTLIQENKNYKAFVRWYDSDPQMDVLSIEGAFSIEDGSIVSYTPRNVLTEIVTVISNTLENKISTEETRDLSSVFSKDMQSGWLTNKLSRSGMVKKNGF